MRQVALAPTAGYVDTSSMGESELPAVPRASSQEVNRIATDSPTQYCTHNAANDPLACGVCNPVREPKPLSGKYKNIKTGKYASKREARRAEELKLLLEAGIIRNLREQVPFLLVPKQDGERSCSYVADFCYDEARQLPQGMRWCAVVEDCKGMRTPLYILKRKLVLLVHRVKIKET